MRPADPNTSSPRAKWEASDIFQNLLFKVEKLPRKIEDDQRLLRIGLNHLRAESRLPRQARDQKAIEQTWGVIKPILLKYGLFAEFNGDVVLRSRLRFFIFNKF